MARYCVDFSPSSSEWISPAGSWAAMGSGSFECARAYVIVDATEFAALEQGQAPPAFTTQEVAALKYMAANPSPWALSVEDGVQISGLILVVWAIAWGFRTVAKSFSIVDDISRD